MTCCIPPELWNQVLVPTKDTEATKISTYISEIAYKIASVADVMMAKEMWHTVCELSLRCGILLERISGTISSSDMTLSSDSAKFGGVVWYVGAGVGGNGVAQGKLVSADSGSITFSSECIGDATSATAYADAAVSPDINAIPDNQVVPKWFLKKYERAILAGTLMRIYSMDAKPWTDGNAARMNATTYLNEINRITHGIITSGMRKQVLIDAESVIARQTSQASQPPQA